MKNIIPALFAATLLFSQCSEDDVQMKCSTPATVRDLTGLDGCGYVFELEDGTRLEPVRNLICGTPPLPKEVTEDPLFNFQFEEGKKGVDRLSTRGRRKHLYGRHAGENNMSHRNFTGGFTRAGTLSNGEMPMPSSFTIIWRLLYRLHPCNPTSGSTLPSHQ